MVAESTSTPTIIKQLREDKKPMKGPDRYRLLPTRAEAQLALDAGQLVPNPAIAGASYLASVPLTIADMFEAASKNDYKDVLLNATGLVPYLKTGMKSAKLASNISKWNAAVNVADITEDVVTLRKELKGKEPKKANGGRLADGFYGKAVGGSLKPLSSETVEVKGPSHENGGVRLPSVGAEVEGNETIKSDFVFSDKLGFADAHRPIAKTIGKLEKSNLGKGTQAAITRLRGQEEKLKLAQEYFKQQNGIQ
jgi:hypothetical protein